MKSKMKIKIKLVESLWLLAMALFIVSCAKGVDDSETFSGGVTNAQLESPEEINFATTTNADGSENLKLSWSVVMGAGGYKVNVHNMNDPVNPVAVVTDSIIDGSSMSFAKLEDTNYHISVLTLGNEKLNNTDAQMATEKDYKAFEAVATIHEGESLAEYVNNDMPDFAQNLEQCIVLEPGVTYQLDAIADFGMNAVTLRGDVENRPTIVIGTDGGLVTQGGLKIKNVNIDCTEMKTQVGIISLSDSPNESVSTTSLGYVDLGAQAGRYVINNPITFQNCNMKNVKNSIIYGNKVKWGVRDFRIMNCIIQLNTAKSIINFYGGGWIKDLTINNSTIYNLNNTAEGYCIEFSSGSDAQPKKTWGNNDKTGSMTITNNTFCRTMSKKKFGNQLPTTSDITITVNHNIFYDVYQLYQAINRNTKRYTIGNTIYGVTQTTNNNDIGGYTDSNGRAYATLEDPNFVGSIDLEFDFTKTNGGVDFTPRGSVAIENKAGDPRWYE